MYYITMEPTIGKKYWVDDISLDHAKLSKKLRIFAGIVDGEYTFVFKDDEHLFPHGDYNVSHCKYFFDPNEFDGIEKTIEQITREQIREINRKYQSGEYRSPEFVRRERYLGEEHEY